MKVENILKCKYIQEYTQPSLKDNIFIKHIILEACKAAKCTICTSGEHHFYPWGYTLFFIISESHVSVSTWPENNMLIINYFSCSDNPYLEEFIESLEKYNIKVENRLSINIDEMILL